MSNTLTVRLPPDLAEWLEAAARDSGMSKGQLIRKQLEKARAQSMKAVSDKPYARFIGCVGGGPRDASSRKGFSAR